MVNKNIFREYDIRGIVGEDVNEDVAYKIGRAFGSYIIENDKFGQINHCGNGSII